MPKGNTLSRLLIASLAAAAVAAPAAVAQPIDPQGTTSSSPQSAQQDLRSEAAADPSRASQSAQQDLRTEATADPSRAPSYPRYVQGPPTWPMHPQPISPAPAHVADAGGGDNGGIDLPVALISIAGTLALGGGFAAVTLRHRTRTAH